METDGERRLANGAKDFKRFPRPQVKAVRNDKRRVMLEEEIDPQERLDRVFACLDRLEPPATGFATPSLIMKGDATVGCALLARLMLTAHGLGPVRLSAAWKRRQAATKKWLALREEWEQASAEVASVLDGTASEEAWRRWRGVDLERTADPARAFESALEQ